MPYEFILPVVLKNAGWKVKIRDGEIREHPHVTIIRGTNWWRINLRTGKYMDRTPRPSMVPKEIGELISEEATWKDLCDQWDLRYPNNPVSGDDESEG